eukprot:6212140-Pleurochrysis_carterae.AAC.3
MRTVRITSYFCCCAADWPLSPSGCAPVSSTRCTRPSTSCANPSPNAQRTPVVIAFARIGCERSAAA